MAAILVVDDDQRILKFISAFLESAGHQVLTASNGLEGLVVLASTLGPFRRFNLAHPKSLIL
jgi:CheY-like chemotaxis protein